MIYAQSVSAQEVTFAVAPHSDDLADKLNHPYGDRARAALEKLAVTRAKTWKALEAKAGVVSLIMKDSHGNLAEREKQFFELFASDVQTLLRTHFSNLSVA